MQILETRTYVQFIQLHMIRLQIFFKQRMKKHKHDVLIKSFCRQIKHHLFETRNRRRRKAEKTSITRKIKWMQAMHNKLSADEKENVAFSNKAFIKFFLKKWRNMWNAYQTKNRRKVYKMLMKNITSKKMKLHKNLIKSENFLIIHIKTKRIKLINYFFFRWIFTMFTLNCFCEHSKSTLRHILLFYKNWSKSRQRMLRENETTNMSRLLNIEKSLKVSIIWLMKINLLT